MRDAEIRAALRIHVERRFAGDPGLLVVDELGLVFDEARVDVAVVNGALHGFEIKSEHDSLARLPGQIVAYGRVFDYVTLVVGRRHAARASGLVPPWWGVIQASPGSHGATLSEVRHERLNPAVEGVAVAQLLWREEA